MVNISQRIQFVGKQNTVLLSEYIDTNHIFIFYAFTQWTDNPIWWIQCCYDMYQVIYM